MRFSQKNGRNLAVRTSNLFRQRGHDVSWPVTTITRPSDAILNLLMEPLFVHDYCDEWWLNWAVFEHSRKCGCQVVELVSLCKAFPLNSLFSLYIIVQHVCNMCAVCAICVCVIRSFVALCFLSDCQTALGWLRLRAIIAMVCASFTRRPSEGIFTDLWIFSAVHFTTLGQTTIW